MKNEQHYSEYMEYTMFNSSLDAQQVQEAFIEKISNRRRVKNTNKRKKRRKKK